MKAWMLYQYFDIILFFQSICAAYTSEMQNASNIALQLFVFGLLLRCSPRKYSLNVTEGSVIKTIQYYQIHFVYIFKNNLCLLNIFGIYFLYILTMFLTMSPCDISIRFSFFKNNATPQISWDESILFLFISNPLWKKEDIFSMWIFANFSYLYLYLYLMIGGQEERLNKNESNLCNMNICKPFLFVFLLIFDGWAGEIE